VEEPFTGLVASELRERCTADRVLALVLEIRLQQEVLRDG
jgi:hypothetical protein